ncbi:hypothetical protein TNCV_700001 [Trichonephila clavipes]|nr:hypothetical protein TNCV_700001 [Trichonephila clavipes]
MLKIDWKQRCVSSLAQLGSSADYYQPFLQLPLYLVSASPNFHTIPTKRYFSPDRLTCFSPLYCVRVELKTRRPRVHDLDQKATSAKMKKSDRRI